MKRLSIGIVLATTAACSMGVGATIPSLSHTVFSSLRSSMNGASKSGQAIHSKGPQATASGSTVPLHHKVAVATSPQSVIVASIGTNAATLSWTSSEHATDYLVYRGTSPDLASAQVITQTSDNRFDDTGLQPKTTYYYWVAGSNAGGVAAPTRSVSFETYDSWSDIEQTYAESVVKVMTYDSVWGVFGSGTVGTGFVVQGGYIVTNYHIIDRWNWAIDVYYLSGTLKYHAKVVDVDKAHDLAVLQIVGATPPDVTPIPLGSNLPHSGDNVAVMGYPANQPLTFSTGTIDNLNSTVNVSGDGLRNVTLHNLIATNAKSVKGNSGSPLFNQYGQVVGVMESESVGGTPTAYAVPASQLAEWGIQ